MSKPRLELKVGIFVTVSLIALALLVMRFSKGVGLWSAQPIKSISKQKMRAAWVPGVSVLMRRESRLEASSRLIYNQTDTGTVLMEVKIKSKPIIYQDAVFSIKQAGLLGDRFISVVPGKTRDGLFAR